MTHVSITEKGNKFAVYIEGHAGYNLAGPDIVCAACSTLAYTLLQSILSLDVAGGINELSYGENKETGSFYIELYADDKAIEQIRVIFQVIEAGYALLANEYPKNVKLYSTSGEK